MTTKLNIFRQFRLFLSVASIAFLFPTPLRAQIGNDNPTGVSGVFNGNVTTAGSYDPYTGNATRSVTDITVAGAVGAYPLAFTRTMNSRYTPGAGTLEMGAAGSWRHSYQWTMEPTVFWTSAPNKWTILPSAYTVNYPDGRRVSFSPAANDTRFRGGPGISDRFQQLAGDGGPCYLLLPDGGRVWFEATVDRQEDEQTHVVTSTFTYQFMGIIDPYGQTTGVTYGANTLTIQEPAGRTLTLYYISTPWNGDTVIDRVVASDGRSVKYNYGGSTTANGTVYTYLGNVVYFSDSTLIAIYAYQTSNVDPNGRPLLSWAIDPMYNGPMWAIGYTFVPGAAGGVYGQLQSENYLDPRTGTPGAVVSSLSVNGTTRTETRGDGPSRTFTYSGARLMSYTDFKGQSASLSYDANGYVNASIDQRLNRTDITNESLTGKSTQVTHPLTPPDTVRAFVQSEYGSATCPDPNNRDGNNPYYLYRTTNERGHFTTYLRDTNKRVIQINYPNGDYETFSYNDFGQVLTHRMTSGGTETFRYDEGLPTARGLMTSYVPPATPSDLHPENHPTTYHYNALDRVDSTTDPRGNTTAFLYNTRGQLTRVTHADNSYVEAGYDNHGDRTSIRDELGHTTTYDYDDYKRVVNVTNPLLKTTTINYALDWANPFLHTTSNPKYVNTPMGKNVVFDYDANFGKIAQTAAAGTADVATTWFEYDEVGNRKKTTDPRSNQTTFGYDARNRRIWMDSPIASDRNGLGHTMNWEYDGVGNKTKETRADDAFRSWEYDIPNRITRVIDWRMSTAEAAITTTTTRDAFNPTTQLTIEHVVDAKNAEYKFEIDAAGRKIRETYPPDASNNTARFVYWHYDVAGNVDQYYNPAGNIKTMSYDDRNRLMNFWWNAGGGKTLTYTYDAASRMTSVVTGVNETTVAFGYDAANRQISEDQTLAGYPTRHVETLRDADGNRSDLFVPGYYLLYYDYTGRNQLAHIKDGNINPAWTYTYDKAGNVTNRFGQWGLPNGVNFGYDALNRVDLVEQGNASIVFARSHYQYDKVSREVATWRDGPQDEAGSKGERFWYSTNNQVKDAWYKADNVWTATPSNPATYRGYTYTTDKLNWSSVNDNGYNAPFVANALNQYTSINGSTPQYDDRFNLRVFSGMTYEHDSANQLTSVTGNGHTGYFTYDGLGRCVKRTVDGVTRLFTYDGWNPIIEFDEAGNWKAMNLYGPGADEILGRYDATLAHLVYKQDKQGNVTFVLNSGNQIVEKYTYDAYGQPTIMDGAGNGRSQSAIGNRFMYTGREWLNELGIYDYRHRYYLPSIGRFVEEDPLGFSGGDANLFRYCGGDPVNGSDPYGLADDRDQRKPPPQKRKDNASSWSSTGSASYTPTGSHIPMTMEQAQAMGYGNTLNGFSNYIRDNVPSGFSSSASFGDLARNAYFNAELNSLGMPLATPGVSFTGGTMEQRQQAMGSVQAIFSTPRGAEMQTQMLDRGFGVTIYVNSQGLNQAYLNSGSVWVDPNNRPWINSTNGIIQASVTRIIAHEFGHALMGSGAHERDWGAMDNVIENENSIMTYLGEPARTSYYFDPNG